jgi:hypothetical protein
MSKFLQISLNFIIIFEYREFSGRHQKVCTIGHFVEKMSKKDFLEKWPIVLFDGGQKIPSIILYIEI